MTVTRKYGMAIAQAIVGLFVGASAIFIYWYNEPPPYTLYDRVVLTPRVEPGGLFKLQIKVNWTKSCYSKLYRNIIDSAQNIFPFEREVRPNTKGFRTFIITSQVPPTAALGPATWEVRTEWFCNPVQNRYFPYNDVLDPIPFEIVPHGSLGRHDNQGSTGCTGHCPAKSQRAFSVID